MNSEKDDDDHWDDNRPLPESPPTYFPTEKIITRKK